MRNSKRRKQVEIESSRWMRRARWIQIQDAYALPLKLKGVKMRLVVGVLAEINHFRCIELWPKISCMIRHHRRLRKMSNRWSRWSTLLYHLSIRIQRLEEGPSRRFPHSSLTRTLSSLSKVIMLVYSLRMQRLRWQLHLIYNHEMPLQILWLKT